MLRPMGLALALLPLAAPPAQTPLHTQISLYPGETNYFGDKAAAGVGDIDGDNVPDYAVGAQRGGTDSGYAVVYSGATAEILATLTGNGTIGAQGARDSFGCSVAGLGDVNGDLVPDLLVGAATDSTYGEIRGVAQVISGSDWSVIREHTGVYVNFGNYVSALGDATGDGVSEYLVCEAWVAVSCYDGATGVRLWRYEGGFWDAVRVGSTVGDANGDGVADALIGAPAVPSSTATYPYVLVLDGATGDVIHNVAGPTWLPFGTSVTWLGDINGDGGSEFIVGKPSAWGVVGSYEIYDGASGTMLYDIEQTIRMGGVVCGVGDQNGDGVPDFAADDNGPKLYSGVDGSLILSYDPTPMVENPSVITWLAAAGDLDGDGVQEVIHSTSSQGAATQGGHVVVYASSSDYLDDLGFALAGAFGDPLLTVEGTLDAGRTLRSSLSNCPAWTPAFLVAGLSEVHLPLVGGTLVPALDTVVGGLSTDLKGVHEWWSPVPPGMPSGTELIFQYWMLDASGPRGATASNAVKGVFP